MRRDGHKIRPEERAGSDFMLTNWRDVGRCKAGDEAIHWVPLGTLRRMVSRATRLKAGRRVRSSSL